MTRKRSRIGKLLLAGCCVTMFAVPVYSHQDDVEVEVFLRDLDANANLAGDVPVVGELQIKNAHAKIKAEGFVSNLALRKVHFRRIAGTQFGIPPGFVANYKVGADGTACLKANGLHILL